MSQTTPGPTAPKAASPTPTPTPSPSKPATPQDAAVSTDVNTAGVTKEESPLVTAAVADKKAGTKYYRLKPGKGHDTILNGNRVTRVAGDGLGPIELTDEQFKSFGDKFEAITDSDVEGELRPVDSTTERLSATNDPNDPTKVGKEGITEA